MKKLLPLQFISIIFKQGKRKKNLPLIPRETKVDPPDSNYSFLNEMLFLVVAKSYLLSSKLK